MFQGQRLRQKHTNQSCQAPPHITPQDHKKTDFSPPTQRKVGHKNTHLGRYPAFGEWFQGLFDDGYASRTPTEGSQDFLQGRVPLVLTGGWNVIAAVEAHGEDEVLILPPVDFGAGSKTGAGSWQWGVSSGCANQEVANDFIEFLMQDEHLVAYSDALGNFPSTQAATEASKYFSEGGLLAPLAEISKAFAMVRPVTPGYAVISSVYDKALHDIMAGSDVQASFDQAAKDIDANIEANDGYGFTQ